MRDVVPDGLKLLWQPDFILALQRVFGPGWRLVFESLALLGGSQLALVVVAWARWFHGRKLAMRLLLALFIGLGVDFLIWNLWPTARPDDPRIRMSTPIPISSFPSGHLVTVLTSWGTLAVARVVPWLAVVVIAVLVGLARLFLGAHYPGDVLGGVVVGALVLGVAVWLWSWLCRLVAGWRWPRTVAVGVVIALAALVAATITQQGRWSLLGLLAGTAVALPLEAYLAARLSTPAELPATGWRRRGLILAVGVAGFLPLALVGWLGKNLPLITGLLVPFLAALWILLGAPLAFQRLGWSEEGARTAEDTVGVPAALRGHV
ncbi:MAG TPA: phosphatase PAP2 family protein [Thermomicrobiales bacterium]|jgi:membrane-associated phospholipid phosphatase